MGLLGGCRGLLGASDTRKGVQKGYQAPISVQISSSDGSSGLFLCLEESPGWFEKMYEAMTSQKAVNLPFSTMIEDPNAQFWCPVASQ
jgi:hypothetical protein